MKTKTYPLSGNPICPNDSTDCNFQDMDGYTDCSKCEHIKIANEQGRLIKRKYVDFKYSIYGAFIVSWISFAAYLIYLYFKSK